MIDKMILYTYNLFPSVFSTKDMVEVQVFTKRDIWLFIFWIFCGKAYPSGLGDATFEAAVSWLNIRGSKNPGETGESVPSFSIHFRFFLHGNVGVEKLNWQPSLPFLQTSMNVAKFAIFLG